MSEKIVVKTYEFTEAQLRVYEQKTAVKTVANTIVAGLAVIGLITLVGVIKDRIDGNKEEDDGLL